MKVLITQLGRIGDMILLTPMFSILKENYPDSTIDVICGTKNYSIIANNPYINNIFIFDKSPFKLIRFFNQVRETNYDYYIDPKDHYSRESSILAGMIKAKNKIGFKSDERSKFNLGIPTNKENEGKHYSEKILNPLKYLNIEVSDKSHKPVLFESPESIKYFQEFREVNNLDKYIVINISASQKRKMWDKEKWVEFINSVNSKYEEKDFDFVITSAPTESEDVKYIIENTSNLIHFQSRNILDVVSLIKNSWLLITPDTALVHIAAAFNIKLLGLFANNPFFYSMFHPLSDEFEVVMTPEGSENIDDIDFTQIYEAFLRISEKL
ncbi:MAG: glycosyltransferase family 9 protein [Candidatus Kapabacteria bacterium]|nr:glycosyltransferase family 9 protein [Candidatus Kapabacteria bacterium]